MWAVFHLEGISNTAKSGEMETLLTPREGEVEV
jgi:hypothetical protein